MSESPARLMLRAGTAAEVPQLIQGFVLAVDLGFARSRASCGLAYCSSGAPVQAKNLQFSQCIDETAALFAKCASATLILEAPLSARFGPEGNPRERGAFEKLDGVDKKGRARVDTRYWYSGPGAATCLAALFFLRGLTRKVETSCELVVYEGFASFKEKGGTDHSDDATLLLREFMSAKKLTSIDHDRDDSVLTVLNMFATSDDCVAPLIVAPEISK